MKKVLLFFIAILLVVVPFCALVIAQDEAVSEVKVTAEVAEPIAAAEDQSKGINIGEVILSFLNSPLGISVVCLILAFILGKLFTAKPKWKALVIKYGPLIMQAVKTAEKNIPDDTDNAGLARLNAALQYLVELEPKLKAVCESDVKQALSAVHASAESNGNLEKKE